jgi:hypothetical protein
VNIRHTVFPGFDPDLPMAFEHWPIYEVQCPRCKKRTPQDVAAEIIGIAEKSIHSIKPDADVIAWNWMVAMGKRSADSGIEQLPSNVIVMACFEQAQSSRYSEKNI